MLAYAVPGFICVKTKLIKPQSISAFAVILMYVCSPSLTFYSFTQVSYSKTLLINMGIFFALSFVIQATVLLTFYAIFRAKGKENVRYRVASVATAFGNCGFMGVPLLQALFPNTPEAVLLSACFLIGMNLLGWTMGSAIITNNAKYLNVKKAFFNPAVIGLIIALPFFITGYKLPDQIYAMITLLGKMTTPLCMIIMGMRLATMSAKTVFCQPLNYVVVAIKQLAMPLFCFAIVWFLPIELYVKQTIFILCATPVASVVLNFSEMLGEGQESAANLVLLGTSMSIITIPLMTLLL